jgi:Transcription factor WhiB
MQFEGSAVRAASRRGEDPPRLCVLAVAAGERDPDDWFPVGRGAEPNATPRQVARLWAKRPAAVAAREVCRRCPARLACLAKAYESPDGEYGIWGGLLPAERRALPLDRLTPAPSSELAS